MESQLIASRIELRLPRSCVRRWHMLLAERLKSEEGAVSTVASERTSALLPATVEWLLTLERLLTHSVRFRMSDRVDFAGGCGDPDQGYRDLGIDLCGDAEAAVGSPSLRPLFDGMAGDAAIFSALLAGRSPIIEIEQQPERIIRMRGRPSLEGAQGLLDAYDIVAESASDLLSSVIRGPKSLPVQAAEEYPEHPLRAAQVPEYLLKLLVSMAVTRIYRLCCHSPHWRVGWRFVSGQDVWDRMDLGGVPWNTIPNPGMRFLADPFPIMWRGVTYVFVEDFDHRRGKGTISVVPFDQNGPSGSARTVLEEPWHLSYPFLFEDGDTIWMIPESSGQNEINLYRATAFPGGWVKEATLIQRLAASDTTIIRHLDRLWMFTTVTNAGRSTDSLSIFTADKLLGPWVAHLGNPLLLDAAAARPAGNLVIRDGRLWRPVQDCRERYGGAIGLAEVTRLSATEYCQVVRKVLRPSAEWPGRRLHTLNRSGRLECIDGSANLPRMRW
jgi:hypothetical protein